MLESAFYMRGAKAPSDYVVGRAMPRRATAPPTSHPLFNSELPCETWKPRRRATAGDGNFGPGDEEG